MPPYIATAKAMPKPSVSAVKQILTAAGYTTGRDGHLTKGGTPLTVTVAGSPAQWGKGTEYIASQLSAVGLNVNLVDIDRATWVARPRAGNLDVNVFPPSSPNSSFTQLAYIAGPLPPKGTSYDYSVDPTVDGDFAAALVADQAHRCQA